VYPIVLMWDELLSLIILFTKIRIFKLLSSTRAIARVSEGGVHHTMLIPAEDNQKMYTTVFGATRRRTDDSIVRRIGKVDTDLAARFISTKGQSAKKNYVQYDTCCVLRVRKEYRKDNCGVVTVTLWPSPRAGPRRKHSARF
jgi:hypothetical protein